MVGFHPDRYFTHCPRNTDMELMKNGLSEPALIRIAQAFEQIMPNFERQVFLAQARDGLEDLELKERVAHLIEVLSHHLPSSFTETAKILKQVPKVWDHGDSNDPLRWFAAWPVTDYVAVYGLGAPKLALETLKHLTCLFSAEFAIRPFILQHPEMCQDLFRQWVSHKDEHVRRLVSEGTRPRLPWGMQLKPYMKDPSVNLPLLDQLKNDSSLYVRRSVANHLNDVAKDNPDTVIEVCEDWYPDASEDLRWVIRHATRTLVKAGHPRVFPLLGYSRNVRVEAIEIQLAKPVVVLGEALEFNFEIRSAVKTKQKMVVDFAVHFVKANGKQQAKVFKLKSLELKGFETQALSKSHPIKAITTRRYYPGVQKLEVLVNGVVML